MLSEVDALAGTPTIASASSERVPCASLLVGDLEVIHRPPARNLLNRPHQHHRPGIVFPAALIRLAVARVIKGAAHLIGRGFIQPDL